MNLPCRVLQLALAEWLCENWKTDAKAARIVTGMKLHLMPTMNPDGFAGKVRENRYQSCEREHGTQQWR